MASLVSIVFTSLALILIPAFFIARRLSVRLSSTNIPSLIKVAEDVRKGKRVELKEKVKRGKMPNHVAIILDGNKRWAEKQGLTVSEGYEAGARRLVENAKDFFAMGVNTVSLFAFSTENWTRPEDEVNYLMTLFEKHIKSEMPCFLRDEVKISVIGNREKIPKSLLSLIREAEEATKSYKGKQLIIAIDYTGKLDILQACKSLVEKVKKGLIRVEDIDDKAMNKELMTNCSEFPNPDLLIRTSGVQKISNFFLWQSAYTELYFPNVLWPEFCEDQYLEALDWYQQRQRRFGRRV